MNVTITVEHRFRYAPDGSVWTQTMFPYSFWQRYLTVFDHVTVAARIEQADTVPTQWFHADGDGVSFEPIPYYLGLKQYLMHAHEISRAAQRIVNGAEAVILRIPSHIAAHFWSALHATGHPYAIEAVGDAYDCYAPGAVQHPLRPIIRGIFGRQMREQCWHAIAASYVSEQALGPRFPAAPDAYSVGCSDVELNTEWLLPIPRQYMAPPSPAALVSIGSLSQMYKAPDILLHAIAICRRYGKDVRLQHIGDGKHRPNLERLAESLGISTAVEFTGQLPSGNAIQQRLDTADLFVMPSRTEGLPRAMIEAMARGLPCIGSLVGGIPELLHIDDCVAPDDAPGLAQKIIDVLEDPDRMTKMSARNLKHAMDYTDDKSTSRRLAFLHQVSDRTAQWLAQKEKLRLAA